MSNDSPYSWNDFVAGWIGGVVGIIIGHPFDTLKVREQLTRKPLVEIFIKTLKNEGVRGFYKGIAAPIISAGIINSVMFGVYGNVARMFLPESSLPNPGLRPEVLLAGGAAGFVQSFISGPFELMKIRSQMHPPADYGDPSLSPYCHSMKCLKKRWRTYGLEGAALGLRATIYRDLPSAAIYMGMYEGFLIFGLKEDEEPSIFQQIFAGGAAGVASWFAVNPIDVIKTRLQADDPRNARYTGFFDCFRQSFRDDGLKLLTTGLRSNILRAFPVNAATFFVYEYALALLQGRSQLPSTSTTS